MTNKQWQASSIDKGHNSITNRDHKLKTVKSECNKIRPKSLSKFKKEHCNGFEETEERDNFFRNRDSLGKGFSRSMDLRGLCFAFIDMIIK